MALPRESESTFVGLDSDDDEANSITLEDWRTILSGGNATLSPAPTSFRAGTTAFHPLSYSPNEFDVDMEGSDEDDYFYKPYRTIHPSLVHRISDSSRPRPTHPRLLEASNFNPKPTPSPTTTPKAEARPTNQPTQAPRRATNNNAGWCMRYLWILVVALATFVVVHHVTTVLVLQTISGAGPMRGTWYVDIIGEIEQFVFGTTLISWSRKNEQTKTNAAQVRIPTLRDPFVRAESPPTPIGLAEAKERGLPEVTTDGAYWRWRLQKQNDYKREFASGLAERREQINCNNDSLLMPSSACYYGESEVDDFTFVGFGIDGDPYSPHQYILESGKRRP